MADNNHSANTLVCETQEALYEKAVKKMNSGKLIVQFAYKIENYLTIAAMFEEVGAYLDAEDLAVKCRELAEKTREAEKKDQYEKALKKKEEACTVEDFEKLEAVLDGLGDYEDAREKQRECEKALENLHGRKKRRRIAVVFLLAACLCLAVFGVKVGFFHYTVGVFYEFVGLDEKAELIFKQTENLLDSEARLSACGARLERMREEEERKALKKAKPGDTIAYGKYNWKVLECRDHLLYVIMAGSNPEEAFYHVPYHNAQENVDWTSAKLRSELNSGVLQDGFSSWEKEQLTETENGDFVGILSLEEAGRYKDILDTLGGMDYWLKTAGQQAGTACFVTGGNTIVASGYPVTSSDISVRPVILIDCSEAAEEETA